MRGCPKFSISINSPPGSPPSALPQDGETGGHKEGNIPRSNSTRSRSPGKLPFISSRAKLRHQRHSPQRNRSLEGFREGGRGREPGSGGREPLQSGISCLLSRGRCGLGPAVGGGGRCGPPITGHRALRETQGTVRGGYSAPTGRTGSGGAEATSWGFSPGWGLSDNPGPPGSSGPPGSPACEKPGQLLRVTALGLAKTLPRMKTGHPPGPHSWI